MEDQVISEFWGFVLNAKSPLAEKDMSYINSYFTKNELVDSLQPPYFSVVFIDMALFNEKQRIN